MAFGLDLQEYLDENPVLGTSLANVLKVGVDLGEFTSMAPNPRTGRADYFGNFVNRAARVAGAAQKGQVLVGSITQEKPCLECACAQPCYVGDRLVKGVQQPMHLFGCCRLP